MKWHKVNYYTASVLLSYVMASVFRMCTAEPHHQAKLPPAMPSGYAHHQIGRHPHPPPPKRPPAPPPPKTTPKPPTKPTTTQPTTTTTTPKPVPRASLSPSPPPEYLVNFRQTGQNRQSGSSKSDYTEHGERNSSNDTWTIH